VRTLAAAACGFALSVTLAAVSCGQASASEAHTPAPIAEKIKQKQQIIEATRLKLEASRAKLHQARFTVMTISQALDETNTNITDVTGQIVSIDATIRHTRARLAVRKHQLSAVQASLELHRQALDNRLVDVYEYGPTTYLEALLDSTSFVDFIQRWDFIHYILRADGELIATINKNEAAYERVVGALETTENDLTTSVQQEQGARAKLSGLADERRQLLTVAQGQRNVVAQQVYQLEEITQAEEARLQALIVEKEREDALEVERARLAAAQARRAAAIAAGLPPPPEPRVGGPVQFAWPVHGPITSPFGMRVDPISGEYSLHTGIDIGADYGTPIQSAADGSVIYAGWYGGYGYAIIIDHGGGFSTLYAHCSSIYVAVNQPVRRGQVIGAVGATGWATGPHLHFEIRINGKPIDPLTRL
jgi:murein DD-endopeptidase MepM/ murein hydrolase activator NlpD